LPLEEGPGLKSPGGMIGPQWYHTGEGGEDGQLRFDVICSLAHPTLLLWLSISGSVEQNAGPANAQSGTHRQGLALGAVLVPTGSNSVRHGFGLFSLYGSTMRPNREIASALKICQRIGAPLSSSRHSRARLGRCCRQAKRALTLTHVWLLAESTTVFGAVE
jgi:hypothetical protein